MTDRQPTIQDIQAVGEPETPSGESFARRWSRRKLTAEADTVSAPAATQPPPQVQPKAEPPCDADLPPLDSLDEQSDYSGFLSPRVSAELKRLALRKLFHSPRFQTRCLLNEYEGNFNDYLPLGDVVTQELRHRLEREAAQKVLQGGEAPRELAAADDHRTDTLADADETPPKPDTDAAATPPPDAGQENV